jgi:LuxR family maltose regulon positive regulatory protein
VNQILTTKLFIPKPRPDLISRPRLIEQLDEGLHRKLTLISAPAGFGKTTLVSKWVAVCKRPVAWLSLDKEDSDPRRFLTYLVAALQKVSIDVGENVLGMLQSSQSPPTDSMLATLLNEIVTIPDDFVLVLDDYHLIEAQPIDHAIDFLLERSPPQMHLVITTREDPNLPLARFRARGQLTEIRVADLRFTASEAAGFLNQTMGLNLTEENIAALEDRTEGWIAGLQLAAISMRGNKDTASFIKSFTGSHHFVLDYLVEEVLLQQPENIQIFLLCTSILDRLCGSLCDAVLLAPSTPGQETLEYIEGANLFLIPLDNERRWYRYHHLFSDLLRQRLQQSSARSNGKDGIDVAELHIRASKWYEDNGLELEAFEHAAAANDIERAERLMEGEGMPLQFRGAMNPVLNWLETLPSDVKDAKPSLWVTYASVLTIVGKPVDSIEKILCSAEAALQNTQPDDKTRDLIGQIAAIRAMLAIPQNQVEIIIDQSHRALEYLHPENLSVRTTASWTLGYAYQLRGDRKAAIQAHAEALAISQESGNTMIAIAAATSLGQIHESENLYHQAAESYRTVLDLAGDPPLPAACEAHLGLARIYYEWNDLDAAQEHGKQSLLLARHMENVDTPAKCELLFARLHLARGDVKSAAENVASVEQFIEQNSFTQLMPDVATLQVLVSLRLGDLTQAADLAEKHKLPLSQTRVHLARGDTSAALAILESYRQQLGAKERCDELLRVIILQAIALHADGEEKQAALVLEEALTLAETGGLIRIFVDEGAPMAELLSKAATQGVMPNFVGKVLGAFETEGKQDEGKSVQPLIEPLSERELEILQLIAQGLSNREIGERLFLALNTVKGHNRRIFSKLQVQRRTEAVARARELDLL